MKINFVRHQHDTERTKTERGRSRRQLFRPFWGSSVWRNEQRGSTVKFPTQALTESRHNTCHREDKSPSVTLMSHKENIGWAKPCKNERHIGSIKDLRPPRNNKLTFQLQRTFKTECAGILHQSLSVCCAVLTSPQKGETAVYGYDPALFWFFQCRVDVLQS